MQRIFVVLLAGVCLFVSTAAQESEEILDFGPDSARISRAEPGSGLAALAGATREETVAAFLRQRHGHDESTVASLTGTELDPSDRRVHIRFRQRVAGLDVYGTYVKATLTPDGEVVSVLENLAPAGTVLQPAVIDYRDALEAALRHRYPGQPTNLHEVASAENSTAYAGGRRFVQNPTVTRVAVPLRGNRMRVGYLVETWDRQNNLWHTVVSGLGQVLHEELRTASEKYRVYYPNPTQPPMIFEMPDAAAGSVVSPLGWTFGTTTTGNNVDAYLDRNADNIPDANGRPLADASGNFVTAANLAQDPTTADNQKASVTSLFFLNNLAHDFLWYFGFNEAAGNFQTDNFGRGGYGNDAVRVEAQDGTGTNNANFSAPPDGSAPRMQMYLWTAANPDRDSGFDADVVLHEYGHGLTWRMIGGMSGKLPAAVGEGMSDAIAVYFTFDDAIGEYSMGNASGFRSSRYFYYSRTYKQVSGYSAHLDGEIYAAAMTRLLLIWVLTGRDYYTLWSHVVDGMNYTPSSPAYEDMRDGILTSMVVNGASVYDRCAVWDAFAAFGIGYGADGRVINTPGQLPKVSISESFARGPECNGVSAAMAAGLTPASLKRLPRARLRSDMYAFLRQRGSSSASAALQLLSPAPRGSARAAAAH